MAMRKSLAPVAAAMAALGAAIVLIPAPAAAFDLEVVAVTISPATARAGEPVTVTARVKRSDPTRPNPVPPALVEVRFIHEGDGKPFVTRQVRLAAQTAVDVSAPWEGAAGRHR